MPPIKPSDVSETVIPEFVFTAVNKLIKLNWNGKSATITQEEIVKEILATTNAARNEIFENHWLDFEQAYQAAGWKVHFDKPGYNESYKAFFVFKKV